MSTPAAASLVADQVRRLDGLGPINLVVDDEVAHAIADAVGLEQEVAAGIVGSALAVTPLVARDRTVGVLLLLRDRARGPFSEPEVAAIADLGVRAGVALDNARLYAQEHDAALQLQQALLPRLPTLDAFDLAATYLPARNYGEVGGDWYDVLDLPEDADDGIATDGVVGGRVGVAVGDVMGHDLQAAAAMGQLRSVLRAYAWSGAEPADVISRLDRLVHGLHIITMATCAYAVVHPHPDGSCPVIYTLAGHPPPLIRHPDGRVEMLEDAVTSPVGVPDARAIQQATADLPVGASLILYTDGLIESRDRAISDGLRRLVDVVSGVANDCTAQQMSDQVISGLGHPSGGSGTSDNPVVRGNGGDGARTDHDDDVCVVVLRRR